MARLMAVLAGLALAAAACGDSGTDAGGRLEPAADPVIEGVSVPPTSTEAPITVVEPVTAAELETLIRANNDFAAELYRKLADDSGDNLALGTWSISSGLALPFVGASGSTADQMAGVLGYVLPGDTQHRGFHTLRQELLDRQNDGVSMAIANRLFGQAGYGFLDRFLAAESAFYDAPLATVDFAADAELARAAINDWTAERTNDRITDLFPTGSISSNTRLVLVNAIHLDANWHYPFNPELTRLEPFLTADGSRVNVEMMKFHEFLPLVETADYQAVRLPYEGQQMSMVAVLPTGPLAGLESGLGAAFFDAVDAGLSDSGIHLSLPKFEISSHHDLIGPLGELGLSEPFEGDADFSAMTGERGLFIASIQHGAFVQIDEEGTEAAAATGTDMALSHGPTIVFDRPFLFYIQDDVTGQVLFLGRVTNPDPAG